MVEVLCLFIYKVRGFGGGINNFNLYQLAYEKLASLYVVSPEVTFPSPYTQ